MNSRSKVKILITLFVAAIAHTCYAADSLTHKYPSAILVELRSEKNRIDAITKDKKYVELEEVTKDAAGENAAMINDFTENFNYCPVYYFMDTNEQLVLKKQFNDVLMDASGHPAKKLVINAASDDYIIVYYGYPVMQARSQGVVKDSANQEDSGEPMGRGLVMDDDKMEQLSYIYKMGYDDMFLNKKKLKNYYTSSHFDIEYFPLAGVFDKKLKKRKNPHHIKISNGG